MNVLHLADYINHWCIRKAFESLTKKNRAISALRSLPDLQPPKLRMPGPNVLLKVSPDPAHLPAGRADEDTCLVMKWHFRLDEWVMPRPQGRQTKPPSMVATDVFLKGAVVGG